MRSPISTEISFWTCTCLLLRYGQFVYVWSHQIGERIPPVDLYPEDSPTKPLNAQELFKGKKGVLFAVVGAFTPGCSQVNPLTWQIYVVFVSRLWIKVFVIISTIYRSNGYEIYWPIHFLWNEYTLPHFDGWLPSSMNIVL